MLKNQKNSRIRKNLENEGVMMDDEVVKVQTEHVSEVIELMNVAKWVHRRLNLDLNLHNHLDRIPVKQGQNVRVV